MQIQNRKTQIFFFMFLILPIAILPLPQILRPNHYKSFLLQVKFYFSLMILAILLFSFLLLTKRLVFSELIQKIKKNTSILCVILLCLFGVISLIGLDRDELIYGLNGLDGRGEGLYTLITYYFIFFISCLLSSRKAKQWLLYFFLFFCTVVTVLAVLQLFNVFTTIKNYAKAASAPFINPNFFASFSVLFSGISMSSFVFYEKKISFFHPQKWVNSLVWFILSLSSFLCCISAFSSVAYVGLLMIFLLISFIEVVFKKNRFIRILLLLLGLFFMMLILNIISEGRVFNEFLSVGKQIEESGSLFDDSVGSHRMEIYKNAIKLVPKNGIIGCGIEGFGRVYFDNFGLLNAGYYIDRAHNEYLNLWISEGIGALISYLIFLFSLFIPMIKEIFHHRKNVELSEVFSIRLVVFVAFFGYIAQAFFNISVIQVAPYFWMFCGFLFQENLTSKDTITGEIPKMFKK